LKFYYAYNFYDGFKPISFPASSVFITILIKHIVTVHSIFFDFEVTLDSSLAFSLACKRERIVSKNQGFTTSNLLCTPILIDLYWVFWLVKVPESCGLLEVGTTRIYSTSSKWLIRASSYLERKVSR
jgi:hypothetical protein